jgi:adenosine deaminase
MYALLPKIELHLHLEGAIPLPALWELIRKYGGAPGVPNLAALERRFVYRDFVHFLLTWGWKNQFLREYDDFAFIAEQVARRLAAQNIRYAEAFFSPADFARHGLQTQRLAEAIRAGLGRVPGIEVALVADLVRDFGPQRAAVTLAELREVQGLGVIGITIGGSEADYPPELFAEAYAQARAWGFHTSAHAGEAAGAESVWGAIRSLHVERIGHGTRAEEDPALLDYLAAQQIPLEMCPLSNVRTGVVASVAAHPLRRYMERGLLVTVSTDDPAMFGNALAGEYQALVDEQGLSHDDIRTLILNGIRASWLPEERKASLAESFSRDPGWLAGRL